MWKIIAKISNKLNIFLWWSLNTKRKRQEGLKHHLYKILDESHWNGRDSEIVLVLDYIIDDNLK